MFVLYKDDIKNLLIINSLFYLTLIFFLLEFSMGNVDFLISDGKRYFENPESWINDTDRRVWGYVNYYVKYIDFYGEFFIKIMNIPVVIIFAKFLQGLFRNLLGNFNIIYFLPYFLYLGISNLRDVLILLLVALILLCLKYIKYPPLFVIVILASFVLFGLRPFVLILLLISFLFARFIKLNQGKLLLNFIALLAFFALSIISYDLISKRIETYSYNLNYYTNEGLSARVDSRGANFLGEINSVNFWINAHLRYAFTPRPTSMLISILDGSDPLTYGLTSKFLRIINQIFYFIAIVYILLNFRKIITAIRIYTAIQFSFLIVMFSYFPIYSFYHFGGVHQRTKIPFQIFIIILAYTIYKYKKKLASE